MTHREHTKTSQLLWSVKDNWRESTGHLGVQTNLDTSLDLEKNRREGLFLRWKVTNARTSKSHDTFQHLAETKIHLTKEICPQTNGLLTVNPAWSSKLSILCMWPYVTLLYFTPYFKGWVALWLEIECEGWINDHKRTKDKLIYLVFTLDQQVKKFLSVDNWFPVVCHQTNQCSIPLVYNLCEGGRAWSHENLSNSVVESLLWFFVNFEKALCSSLFGYLYEWILGI